MTPLLALALSLPVAASAPRQEVPVPKPVADLAWMLGTWSGKGTIAFGGRETAIESTTTIGFDGQFLKLVSADASGGFTMTKTVMVGWDASKSRYDSYSFTNLAPKPRIAHGKMEGNKLVLESEPWEAEGMTAIARETMTRISPDQLGVMMEFKIGEKWAKGMDLVLGKKSS